MIAHILCAIALRSLDYSYIGGLALRCNYLITRIVYIFRGMSFHFVGDSAMNAQTACTNQSQHAVPRVAEAHSRLSGNHAGLLANLGFVAILSLTQNDAAFAATAPSLGSDSTYAIVSGTYTNSLNAGTETRIIGLSALSPTVCYDTGPTTPPILIFGAITTPCTSALNVGLDFNTALANLNAQALLPSCINLGLGAVNLDAVNLGAGPGVFAPGCYTNGGAMGIVANGIVTLNGRGVYIFKPGGRLLLEPIPS